MKKLLAINAVWLLSSCYQQEPLYEAPKAKITPKITITDERAKNDNENIEKKPAMDASQKIACKEESDCAAIPKEGACFPCAGESKLVTKDEAMKVMDPIIKRCMEAKEQPNCQEFDVGSCVEGFCEIQTMSKEEMKAKADAIRKEYEKNQKHNPKDMGAGYPSSQLKHGQPQGYGSSRPGYGQPQGYNSPRSGYGQPPSYGGESYERAPTGSPEGWGYDFPDQASSRSLKSRSPRP